MMIYLTGADTSLAKSSAAPQNDASKSLGGYVSSTPVPNGELNALFDLISAYTLEKKSREIIALGLINKLTQAVTNVTLKIVVGRDALATFRVAAVTLDSSLAMERISNRYAEPLIAEFHNADFQRASVDIEILNPANVGEEIALYPFNISLTVREAGIEGTWNALENAFSNDATYEITRLSERRFRLAVRDERVLDEPLKCSYLATGGFTATFEGELSNGVTNEVVLVDDGVALEPNGGIGLWLSRDLKSYKYPTNEQLVEDFKNKMERAEVETAEIVISYNLVNVENYSEDYNKENYS